MDVKLDPRTLLKTNMDDLKALADSVREGGLVGAVMGAERKAILDRVQGTMGLVEGHAEWAMDRAGGGRRGRRRRAARRDGPPPRGPRAALADPRPPPRLRPQAQAVRPGPRSSATRSSPPAARPASSTPGRPPDLAPTSAELAAPAAWLARTEPRAAEPPAHGPPHRPTSVRWPDWGPMAMAMTSVTVRVPDVTQLLVKPRVMPLQRVVAQRSRSPSARSRRRCRCSCGPGR